MVVDAFMCYEDWNVKVTVSSVPILRHYEYERDYCPYKHDFKAHYGHILIGLHNF